MTAGYVGSRIQYCEADRLKLLALGLDEWAIGLIEGAARRSRDSIGAETNLIRDKLLQVADAVEALEGAVRGLPEDAHDILSGAFDYRKDANTTLDDLMRDIARLRAAATGAVPEARGRGRPNHGKHDALIFCVIEEAKRCGIANPSIMARAVEIAFDGAGIRPSNARQMVYRVLKYNVF